MGTALVVAFAAGWLARVAGLPALVGYLIAGFGLHAAGFEADATLQLAADLGVLILLFGIGLKLKVGTLVRPLVWGTAFAFGTFGTAITAGSLLALGAIGMPLASDLSVGSALIVGFALSFSSTVFAVQALEHDNEGGSLVGRVAIAILIVQDIAAVIFLVVSEGEWPSPIALLVFVGFFAAQRPLRWLLDRAGHGEVLVLLGFALAIGAGAGTFAWVGLKPDLGALLAGLLLASHPRAGELAERLLDFKDLLLVAFFLSIGLAGAPPAWAWWIGLGAAAVMPIRSAVLFWLLARFRLRVRTAFHTSVTLSTFSEFGLIAGTAAVGAGLINADWLAVIAVAVAVSLGSASVLTASRYRLYGGWSEWLQRFERHPPLPDDAVLEIDDARILVFGMGRIGFGSYVELERQLGQCVIGVDRSERVVERHTDNGLRVVRGDALDRDFWERVQFHPGVELVVAAMSNHDANVECISRVKEFLPNARTAAIANYPDQVTALQEVGVDVARNLYEEAGQALADDATEALGLER